MKNGPGFNESQRIGELARAALYANKPDFLILDEGTASDFGYDFNGIAAHPIEGCQFAFKIQLKGTTQESVRLADGISLSHAFNVTTLNLWQQSGSLVLIIIADFVDSQDQKTAPVYYHFANEDLERILSEISDQQRSVNIRIPKSQVFNKDLDLIPIIQPYIREFEEVRREIMRRRQSEGSVVAGLFSVRTENSSSITYENDNIESILDAVAPDSGLKSALENIRSGDYSKALSLCAEPSQELISDNPQVSALALHIRSLALNAVGDFDAANRLTELAFRLFPECDDIAGSYAQMQLNAIGEFDDRDSLDHLLNSLDGANGICVTGIKAKIHALCGRFDEGRQSLDQYDSDKTYLSRILISVVERSWNRVIEEVATAFERQVLKPRQQLILRMFDARAHYQRALRNALGADKKDLFVPSTGLPGIDFTELEQAYASSLEAMLEAQRLNWPSDIHLIMDVFPSSAMILGRGSEAMPILTALGLSRGNIPTIREIVCKVAVQLDHPEVALQLIDRAKSLAKFPYEDSIFAVAALKAGMPHKALEIVTDEYIGNESSDDVFLSSLLMLGMAANSAVRPDLLNKISDRLGNSLEARNYQAILNSAIKVQEDFLLKPTAIKELYSYWSDNEKPAVIGGHLLINLDTSVRDQAELYIEVASHMASISAHSCEDYYHLGHAHMTMQQLDIAEKILREALNRFPHDIKIKSLLGVVLEQAGKSPDAFFLFEQLLEESNASESARSYYVNIAIRMGFFNKAEAQIRNGIANARNAKEKLSLLGTLFQLLMAEGTRPDLIEGTAWEFGKAANQDNEFEEGAFLQQYLFATQREDSPKKTERIEEFKERFERFFSKFPDSKVLWRAEMPADGAPADLFSSLLDAVGLTKKDIEVANNIERRMDCGALQVPFSWRPKRFLRNIPDIFMLWEIRRKAPQERAAMHFSNSAAEYSRNVPNNLSSYEAVLSLASILLLHEIDLLDIVLDTFPKIFIARATLLALQEARSSISGGWGIKRATEIYEALQKHLTKMSSSPYGIVNTTNYAPDWHAEELHAMSQRERVYFCDDILETYIVCKTEKSDFSFPSISTVDFLTWADQKARIITPELVSEKIANMISKRVNSITVIQRYLLAAIPQDLINAKNQSQAIEAIDENPTLSILISGIWNHFKPFNQLRDHFSSNMAFLINNGVSNNEVIVYLWSVWASAVRFQQEPELDIENKMADSFLHILFHLESDEVKIRQLWSAFSTTFKRFLSDRLTCPEDQFCALIVANILGVIRADQSKEKLAADLFEKAMKGLVTGGQQADLFSKEYVEVMGKVVQEQLSKNKS